MARKTAFIYEMILKTLNQNQQTVPPAIQKVATLDDKVGEIFNRKRLNCPATSTSSYANHTFVHVQKRINFGNCY